MGALRVGTSGYVYRHWRGLFYPEGLAAKRWLPFNDLGGDAVEDAALLRKLTDRTEVA